MVLRMTRMFIGVVTSALLPLSKARYCAWLECLTVFIFREWAARVSISSPAPPPRICCQEKLGCKNVFWIFSNMLVKISHIQSWATISTSALTRQSANDKRQKMYINTFARMLKYWCVYDWCGNDIESENPNNQFFILISGLITKMLQNFADTTKIIWQIVVVLIFFLTRCPIREEYKL